MIDKIEVGKKYLLNEDGHNRTVITEDGIPSLKDGFIHFKSTANLFGSSDNFSTVKWFKEHAEPHVEATTHVDQATGWTNVFQAYPNRRA